MFTYNFLLNSLLDAVENIKRNTYNIRYDWQAGRQAEVVFGGVQWGAFGCANGFVGIGIGITID